MEKKTILWDQSLPWVDAENQNRLMEALEKQPMDVTSELIKFKWQPWWWVAGFPEYCQDLFLEENIDSIAITLNYHEAVELWENVGIYLKWFLEEWKWKLDNKQKRFVTIRWTVKEKEESFTKILQFANVLQSGVKRELIEE